MQPVAVVVGVGSEQGLGAAVARRFVAGGFHVIVGGRTGDKLERVVNGLGKNGTPFLLDATKEEDVVRLFQLASAPGVGRAPASVVVFNAGNNQHIPFLSVSGQQFEDFWRVGCLAGFLVGREATKVLLPQGSGTIIFTGASASLRGRPGFAHFSAAKAGLRMLSQSMAREFAPQGIHVAHVVIDGGINGTRLKAARPEIVQQRGVDGLLNIEALAEAYWQLHLQHRTAWTHEIDIRPYKETF